MLGNFVQSSALLLGLSFLGLACDSGVEPLPARENKTATAPSGVSSIEDKLAELEARNKPENLEPKVEAKPSDATILNGEISLEVLKPIAFRRDRARAQAGGELKAKLSKVGQDLLLVEYSYHSDSLVIGVSQGDAITLWLSGDDQNALVVTHYLADSRFRDVEVFNAFEGERIKLESKELVWIAAPSMKDMTYRVQVLVKMPKLSAASYRASLHYFGSGQEGQAQAIASFPEGVSTTNIEPATYAKFAYDGLALNALDVKAFQERSNLERDRFAVLVDSAKASREAEEKLPEIEDPEARLVKEREIKQARIAELSEYSTLYPHLAMAAEDVIYALSPAEVSAERVIDFSKRFPMLLQSSLGMAEIIYQDSRIEEFYRALRGIAEPALASESDYRSQAISMLATYALSFGLMDAKNLEASVTFMAALEGFYEKLDNFDRSLLEQNRLLLEVARKQGDDDALAVILAKSLQSKNEQNALNELYRYMAEADYKDTYDATQVTRRLLKAFAGNANPDAALYWLNLQMALHTISTPDPSFVREFVRTFEAMVMAAPAPTSSEEKEERARFVATLGLADGLYGPIEGADAALEQAALKITELLGEDAPVFLDRFANLTISSFHGYPDDDRAAWQAEHTSVVTKFVDAHGLMDIRVSLRELLINLQKEARAFDSLTALGRELLELLSQVPADDEAIPAARQSGLKQMARLAIAHGFFVGTAGDAASRSAFLAEAKSDLPSIVTALLARERLSSNMQDRVPEGALRFALMNADQKQVLAPRALAAINEALQSLSGKEDAPHRFNMTLELAGFFSEIGDQASSDQFFALAASVANSVEDKASVQKYAGYRRYLFMPLLAKERAGDYATALEAAKAALLADPNHAFKNDLSQMISRLEFEAALNSAEANAEAMTAWIEKSRLQINTVLNQAYAWPEPKTDVNGASFVPAGALNEIITNGTLEAKERLLKNVEAMVTAFIAAQESGAAFSLALKTSEVLYHIADYAGVERMRAITTKINGENPKAAEATLDDWKIFLRQGVLLIAAKGDFKSAEAEARRLLEVLPKDDVRLLQEFKSYADIYSGMTELWLAEKIKREAAKDLPRLLVTTDLGSFEVEVFEDDVPNHSINFVQLAEEGFYNGIRFHRHVPHFVIQGGADTEDGMGSPSWTIRNEGKRPHFRGSLAMARSQDPDSASAQFYIVTDNSPNAASLNGAYTVFGRVTKGMDVVDRIRVGTRLLKVEVVSKRDHAYQAKRNQR